MELTILLILVYSTLIWLRLDKTNDYLEIIINELKRR